MYLNPPWTLRDLKRLLQLAPSLDAFSAAEILNEASELFDLTSVSTISFKAKSVPAAKLYRLAIESRADTLWKARFLRKVSKCPPGAYGRKLQLFLMGCHRLVEHAKPLRQGGEDLDDWSIGLNTKARHTAAPNRDASPLKIRERARPPVNAEFLLHLVLPEDRIDDAVGDLEERFGKKVDRLGFRRASIWYYKQIVCSLWPYGKAAARRMSSGLAVKLVALALRAFGQNEIANELLQARTRTIGSR